MNSLALFYASAGLIGLWLCLSLALPQAARPIEDQQQYVADDEWAGSRPHLVFVYVDDWGYADVGFRNPNISTPNFDEMVAEGLLLNRHYVYSICSPSRASFLSGRWPHHAHQWNIPADVTLGLNTNFTTLPEKLKKAGYATHLIGKWHLGFYKADLLPINRGFDTSSGFLTGAESHMKQKPVINGPPICSQSTDFWRNAAPDQRNGTYDTWIYESDIREIIEKHAPSTPLFLYLSLHNVHSPFEAPDKWVEKYANQSTCDTRKVYQAMVSVADNITGTLVNLLKKKGMWERSLVVVSADNGGAPCGGSNYPLRGIKGTLFEGGVRSLAFADGGIIPQHMRGKTIPSLIHTADWYPTFCYLAGVDADDTGPGRFPVDGLNVWPLLSGEKHKSSHAEIVLGFNYSHKETGAIIVEPFKLIVGNQHRKPEYCLSTGWTSQDAPCHNGTEGDDCEPYCLFNIIEDPNEHVNLATVLPQKLNELLQRYAAYSKEPRSMQDQGYHGGDLPHDPDACPYMAANGGYWQPWKHRTVTTHWDNSTRHIGSARKFN